MAEIPDPKNYPNSTDVHPRIAERLWQIQEQRFAENYPGGKPLDQILDPKEFPWLFDKV